MVAPDERGLVSKAAAVLALNSLRVHSASVNIHEGVAITEFVVSPLFGSPPAADTVASAVRRCPRTATSTSSASLEKRDSEATSSATARAGEVQVGVPVTRSTAPPRILWLDTDTPGQLIVEVRAMDRTGLLALLTRALERAETDIVWAKVNTFGSTAADVFCVTCRRNRRRAAVDETARAELRKHLSAVVGCPGDVAVTSRGDHGLLGVELPHGNDACLELIAGRRGDRRPAAATAQVRCGSIRVACRCGGGRSTPAS